MNETKETTAVILSRLENSLLSIEQTSFDAINITDKLVMLIGEAREASENLQDASKEELAKATETMEKILEQLLSTAFKVNNVAHDLEKEAAYQRETTETIKQIVDFLSME